MSAPTPRASSSLLDPAALMSIRNLELRARAVVEGFWHGLHRSPYHGFSVEFTEYRPYTPGDDPRYLDWKLAGRTDRYFIKKFEDETNLRCHLLVDLSRSMSFGSPGYSKADYARTLAATLGWFLSQQGDAIGLMTFDGAVREYLPARHRPGHLRQLMLALEKPAEGRGTDLAAPLRRMVELVRKRGLVVLISDLLAPIDSLAGALALLTAGGHEVIVFQVLDPAELNFDFAAAARFEDLETGRDVFLGLPWRVKATCAVSPRTSRRCGKTVSGWVFCSSRFRAHIRWKRSCSISSRPAPVAARSSAGERPWHELSGATLRPRCAGGCGPDRFSPHPPDDPREDAVQHPHVSRSFAPAALPSAAGWKTWGSSCCAASPSPCSPGPSPALFCTACCPVPRPIPAGAS